MCPSLMLWTINNCPDSSPVITLIIEGLYMAATWTTAATICLDHLPILLSFSVSLSSLPHTTSRSLNPGRPTGKEGFEFYIEDTMAKCCYPGMSGLASISSDALYSRRLPRTFQLAKSMSYTPFFHQRLLSS